jgi:hypothetical protein
MRARTALVSALIAQLALAGERNGSERCLECGSVNVERFDGNYSELDPYGTEGATIHTGFFHPGYHLRGLRYGKKTGQICD